MFTLARSSQRLRITKRLNNRTLPLRAASRTGNSLLAPALMRSMKAYVFAMFHIGEKLATTRIIKQLNNRTLPLRAASRTGNSLHAPALMRSMKAYVFANVPHWREARSDSAAEPNSPTGGLPNPTTANERSSPEFPLFFHKAT